MGSANREEMGRRATGDARWRLPVALAVLWLTPGWTFSQTIHSPRRLAEGPAGQLLVADRSPGAVVAVDRQTLRPVWSFLLPEEGLPFGLASWNRLIFVGNTETRSVEVYRMQGSASRGMELQFAYTLGLAAPGSTPAIGNPISVAVDPAARLVFVLDGHAKEVRIFSPEGRDQGSFLPADEAGDVLSPVSLAVDPARGEVLVGDYGDPSGSFRARKPARILIYGQGGELRFRIDGDGSTHSTTRFSRVQGMAAGGDGRIFATDPLGGRVLVLDREDGALLAEIGEPGPEPGQLRVPTDVWLDPQTGDLFVSNHQGARPLEVFRGAGR